MKRRGFFLGLMAASAVAAIGVDELRALAPAEDEWYLESLNINPSSLRVAA